MKLLIIVFLLISIEAYDRAVKITVAMRNEQRVALVIGNNAYQGALSKLNNPINDARAIKNILESRGFNVIYLEDASKKSMRKNIKFFSKKIKNGGVGLFYFSGHGIEVDGKNYIIPIDSDINEKGDAEFEAISLKEITNRMQSANNRLNIVILDACRNNPFSRAMGSGGLSKIEPRGLFVSYSTEAGKTASDGRVGENGLFTKYLIKYIQEPGLNLSKVFKKTREGVYTESHGKQFPAIYDQTIKGDFYFTLPNQEVSVENLKPIKDESYKPKITEPPTIKISKENPIIKPTPIPDATIIENGDYITILLPGTKNSQTKGNIGTIRNDNIVTIGGVRYQNYPFNRKFTWEEAKNYCRNLELLNSGDWRLPTRKELNNMSNIYMYGEFNNGWKSWFSKNKSKALINSKGYSFFIKQDFLENMPKHSYFWSSESHDNANAWLINFLYGGEGLKDKMNTNYALCVNTI